MEPNKGVGRFWCPPPLRWGLWRGRDGCLCGMNNTTDRTFLEFKKNSILLFYKLCCEVSNSIINTSNDIISNADSLYDWKM